VFGEGFGTEHRCDRDETHQGDAGLHGLTTGGRGRDRVAAATPVRNLLFIEAVGIH
jgi:hypothetical protein